MTKLTKWRVAGELLLMPAVVALVLSVAWCVRP